MSTGSHNTVAIDARWLFTGIGTYTLNLLRQLKGLDGDVCIRALTTRVNAPAVRPFCDEIAIVDAPIYTLREQIGVPWASRHSGLLHVPHYNFPLLRRGPLLVTIADLIHLLDVQERASLKSVCYARPMLRMAAGRAEHIFTVSEYSKRKIIETLRVAPQKITVAYNGVSDHFRPVNRQWACRVVASALGIRVPYILFVGNLKPHKNVAGLLRAFAYLHSRTRLDQMLLIVGGGRRAMNACQRDAAALGIGDRVVFRSGIPEHLLVRAYGAADLVVQPSFQEGFGLPVLEAMACGTPVACARATSLPEVAADAAEYFDPHSHEEMASAMQRVLQDSELQQRLRTRGLSRAAQFSWEHSAQAHYRVYRSFLN